jgi:ATP-dependent Clp protease ATP-binding subunit ClpB
MPVQIDELRRRIMQLEIEREALKIENDDASKKRLGILEEELANVNEENDALSARWEQEKSELDSVAQIKDSIDAKETELDQAKRRSDFETASRIQYGDLVQLNEQLSAAEAELDASDRDGESLIKEEVDSEEIAEVVSKWTGIPVSKLVEGEREKLLDMEERLIGRVVGQQEAVVAVSEAVRRNRAGLGETNRPIGSFLFLGPTGVGKTEICKALAEDLFDTEDAMIRIDMSEYMEQHAVARLIGAPSRIRRLRTRWPAYRIGSPPTLLCGALRRDGEGASGRLEHPAAGA